MKSGLPFIRGLAAVLLSGAVGCSVEAPDPGPPPRPYARFRDEGDSFEVILEVDRPVYFDSCVPSNALSIVSDSLLADEEKRVFSLPSTPHYLDGKYFESAVHPTVRCVAECQAVPRKSSLPATYYVETSPLPSQDDPKVEVPAFETRRHTGHFDLSVDYAESRECSVPLKRLVLPLEELAEP